jgi:hypothetical protein
MLSLDRKITGNCSTISVVPGWKIFQRLGNQELGALIIMKSLKLKKQIVFTRPLHQKASCTEQITLRSLSFKRVAEKINTSTI